MTQRFLDTTVVEAARERVALAFDHFDTVIVSISGGKDSTVLAHLAVQEAARRDRKVGLFFLDEEVVYQATIDQVEYLMGLDPVHTNRLWLQVEFCLTNATSATEGQLRCWEAGKHKLWMRPKGRDNITNPPWPKEQERFRSGYTWLDFYGVIENFERCYADAAFLVGLRGAEHPNRWRAVTHHPVEIGGRRVYYATDKGRGNAALYPLYDWNAHDVWRYIAEHGLRYSHVYDMQFRKGFSLAEMRCSSLIHEKAFKSIVELPEFEPKTYARLLRRIKGISFVQETGRDARMFRARKLPKNYGSWIAYRDFLLRTHPDPERRPLFERRFARHLENEYVARQQCRQLILNDYENNLPVDNKPDPREELVNYYREVL